jgi:ActR/RegA family two-component response regulator
MASLLLVTEDPGFATAAAALSTSDLTVTHAHAEEAIAIARQGVPDIFAVDTDSVAEAGPLITTLSLITRSIVVAVAHQAWPGSEAADGRRRAGADAVLPKPSGTASPSLVDADREAYALWFLDLVRSPREGPP